ncbi:type IV pilus twitching motility protein PilT [Candidatus Saccharibacteria bacterium]|nr:type IV pilus twitching motility protein PilT [Candidatus Saccharibacteria bacterium]
MEAKDLKIEQLLEETVRRNASDLHIQVGLQPHLRIDGALNPIAGSPILDDPNMERIVYSLLDSEQQQILVKDKEYDFSFSFGEVARFRVNAFRERGSLAAAFRLIPNRIPALEELGLPQVISTFAAYPRGLVLVTGPTGSGKSTTLAALIDKINSERSSHIITIEDPIEFMHKSKRSVVVQREVHYDTFSFSAALRSALRQDPDVILIGEMRDLETMQAAITIAETGHLVFATLHTNSAATSVDRIIDVFPAHQQPQVRSQLAGNLQAICSQRLLPKISGGRAMAMEILVANSAMRNIVREGKTNQLDAVIQTGIDQGMISMDKSLATLVHKGQVTLEDARSIASNPLTFDQLVGNRSTSGGAGAQF